MTKEELEKEATAYALEWGDKTDGTYACCRDGYLAAAEPREKRIAELEQACDETQKLLNKQIEATYKVFEENASLIQENEEMKKGLGCETCQIHLEYMSLNNRIADLERDNAELKVGKDINVTTKPEQSMQLTEAKEIIRHLLFHLQKDTFAVIYETEKETVSRAKGFLRENI